MLSRDLGTALLSNCSVSFQTRSVSAESPVHTHGAQHDLAQSVPKAALECKAPWLTIVKPTTEKPQPGPHAKDQPLMKGD